MENKTGEGEGSETFMALASNRVPRKTMRNEGISTVELTCKHVSYHGNQRPLHSFTVTVRCQAADRCMRLIQAGCCCMPSSMICIYHSTLPSFL